MLTFHLHWLFVLGFIIFGVLWNICVLELNLFGLFCIDGFLLLRFFLFEFPIFLVKLPREETKGQKCQDLLNQNWNELRDKRAQYRAKQCTWQKDVN